MRLKPMGTKGISFGALKNGPLDDDLDSTSVRV